MLCSAWSNFRREDRKVVGRARRLERFLTQPFFTTEQFTGLKGKLVSLKDALDGCERILRDDFKDYPESALYMIGTIDEAKARAKPPACSPGYTGRDRCEDRVERGRRIASRSRVRAQPNTGGKFSPISNMPRYP